METMPTFIIDGRLLIGAEAKDAWKEQEARCNCGSFGDETHSISGECEDMPAVWLGCDNCTGTACGRPLVYRAKSQIDYARECIRQAQPEVIAAKQAAREKSQRQHIEQLNRGWDGFQFIGVEAGKEKAARIID